MKITVNENKLTIDGIEINIDNIGAIDYNNQNKKIYIENEDSLVGIREYCELEAQDIIDTLSQLLDERFVKVNGVIVNKERVKKVKDVESKNVIQVIGKKNKVVAEIKLNNIDGLDRTFEAIEIMEALEK